MVRPEEVSARKGIIEKAQSLVAATNQGKEGAIEELRAFLRQYPGALSTTAETGGGLRPTPKLPKKLEPWQYAYSSDNLAAEEAAQRREAATQRIADTRTLPEQPPAKTFEDTIASEAAEAKTPEERDKLVDLYTTGPSGAGGGLMQTQYATAKQRSVGAQPGTPIEQGQLNMARLTANPEIVERLFPGKTAVQVGRELVDALKEAQASGGKKTAALTKINKLFTERVPDSFKVPSKAQSLQPSTVGTINKRDLADVYSALKTNQLSAKDQLASLGGEEATRNFENVSREPISREMDPSEAASLAEEGVRFYLGEMSPAEERNFVDRRNYVKQPGELQRSIAGINLNPDRAETGYDRLAPDVQRMRAQEMLNVATGQEMKLGEMPGMRYNPGVPTPAPAQISRSAIPLVQTPPTIGGLPGALQDRLGAAGYKPQGIDEAQAAQLARALGIPVAQLMAMLLLGGGGMGLAQGLLGGQYAQQGQAG